MPKKPTDWPARYRKAKPPTSSPSTPISPV
jgi:hypothetical protein